ncbi:MAG: fructose-6-phosphate aldolase [Clostridia bacterium]|nr:fructose-6-phosphate aldolase [Clostridia bacterium]
MKIFLDSANINDVTNAYNMGAITGVTTNPTIISRENKKFDDVLAEILAATGPEILVFAEVLALDAEGMIKEGRAIAAKSSNIVVKVPALAEGLKAAKVLSSEGIKVCVTVCYSPTQAILAANAGATFVAPFVGRLDDIGENGLNLVQDIRDIFDAQGIETQIIAASVRHPIHVIELAKMGCDIATMPFKVIQQMIANPNTDRAVAGFLKDWEKVPK